MQYRQPCKQIEWFNLAIVRITQSRDARWRFRSDECFGKEQDNDDSPDSGGKKEEAMGNKRSSPFTNQLPSSQLALIGCMNLLGIFRETVQVPGLDFTVAW